MTIHLHHLYGCAPTPLAHYLKAIGILRLVAQQKDAEVRGFWRDQHFCLLTILDQHALEKFFLEEYGPTPFVSPWNKGSGFYATNDRGLAPVEGSRAPRLEAFRRAIAEARTPLTPITKADGEVRRLKDQTKPKKRAEAARSKSDPDYKTELAAAEREFKRLKADLYGPFALAWRGPHRDWMDAAMVLSPEGEPSWPALLGTGGNDGRLDFTNTAMQRLGDLFDLASIRGDATPTTKALLMTALFDTPSAALLNAAVGQFLPGSAGGANGTTGPDAESRINPWDFILMLEGAVAFRGQATRKLGARNDMRAAIPFAVAAQSVGYPTRGKDKDARGEQWMPFWDRPASWQDVSALFGEGRAQLGRSSARRPVDFARAIARLGVARGLTGFVRYGYLERNGQSNLAVPLGRLEVTAHPRARLIDEIGGWIDRLQRDADDAPARLSVAVGVLADAVFDVLTCEAEPARWQSVLAAIDEVQRVQASGTAFKIGPCPTLSEGWLDAAADGSPEWRPRGPRNLEGARSCPSDRRNQASSREADEGTPEGDRRDSERLSCRFHRLPPAGHRLVESAEVESSPRDSVGSLLARSGSPRGRAAVVSARLWRGSCRDDAPCAHDAERLEVRAPNGRAHTPAGGTAPQGLGVQARFRR